jgi:hypothetical protein
MTMFHMANDSDLFCDTPAPGDLPLYEAKMIEHYDHRAGSYENRTGERGFRVLPPTPRVSYEDPNYSVTPYYWVDRTSVDSRLGGKWARKWFTEV